MGAAESEQLRHRKASHLGGVKMASSVDSN